MTKGILGRKIGMTQVFGENGELIPVTVVEAKENVVLQKKTVEVDGYNAIQVGFEDKKAYKKDAKSNKYANKPAEGHAKKADAAPKRFIREFRNVDVDAYEVGQEVSVDTFVAGDVIDVTGVSKGKGFQGGVKRWNFRTQDATHGNSLSHRVLGSIGQNQTPGRVFKGKKMAGHLGAERVTVQSLEVVRVDAERKLLLVKGSVPGAINGDVIVKPAVKA